MTAESSNSPLPIGDNPSLAAACTGVLAPAWRLARASPL
jgi:hypothetical protein